MQLTASLDVDVITARTEEISALIDISGPAGPRRVAPRPAATVQVVLDRSASMAGDRLDGAKTALLDLVSGLDARDTFGLVTFDGTAQVVVPAGPLADKARTRLAIAAITAGHTTDLSAGYLQGLQEVRRVAGPAGATLLLISDGHANAGFVDPDILGVLASVAHRRGVTTTTLSYGPSHDGRLMSAIARGGAGNAHVVEDPAAAARLFSAEIEGLRAPAAHDTSLRVMPAPGISGVRVGDTLVAATDQGVVFDFGAFYAGETHRLRLTFLLAEISETCALPLATLELGWVALPDHTRHSLTVPVHVTVVPTAVAAHRIADPQVRTELADRDARASDSYPHRARDRSALRPCSAVSLSGSPRFNMSRATPTIRSTMPPRALPSMARRNIAERFNVLGRAHSLVDAFLKVWHALPIVS